MTQSVCQEMTGRLVHALQEHPTCGQRDAVAALVRALVSYTIASRSSPDAVVDEFYRCFEYTATRWGQPAPPAGGAERRAP